MIYPLAVFTAAAGILSALVLGADRLQTTSAAGLPWLVPTIGAGALLVVAMEFSRRAAPGGDAGDLLRNFATAYALGAACFGLVPIRALAGIYFAAIGPALEVAHWGFVALAAGQSIRAGVLNVHFAYRVKSREAKSAATAAALAIGGAWWAVLAGPPAAELVVTLAALVIGCNAAAPAVQLAVLPRRTA